MSTSTFHLLLACVCAHVMLVPGPLPDFGTLAPPQGSNWLTRRRSSTSSRVTPQPSISSLSPSSSSLAAGTSAAPASPPASKRLTSFTTAGAATSLFAKKKEASQEVISEQARRKNTKGQRAEREANIEVGWWFAGVWKEMSCNSLQLSLRHTLSFLSSEHTLMSRCVLIRLCSVFENHRKSRKNREQMRNERCELSRLRKTKAKRWFWTQRTKVASRYDLLLWWCVQHT